MRAKECRQRNGSDMNQVRQVEKLRELHRRGILEEGHYHAALHAPVFEWMPPEGAREMTAEESEFVRQNIETGSSNVPTVAPFDCFRVSMRHAFDLWFRYPQQRRWLLFRVAYADERGPEQWCVNIYGWDAGDQCQYRLWDDGKLVGLDRLADSTGKPLATVREAMQRMTRTLSYFLFETMLPGNTVLKVEPPARPGKSVEWRLARTHYLVLNRKQAEACQRRQSAPTAHDLKRAAHWRRAHFRRLASDKFKRRGALVPVRQAWVGPTEWLGLDGKIYKVLELGKGMGAKA